MERAYVADQVLGQPMLLSLSAPAWQLTRAATVTTHLGRYQGWAWKPTMSRLWPQTLLPVR
jgi:hypothetical protein